MRGGRRRAWRIELWRIVQRLRDGVETPESVARLAEREAFLRKKLGRFPRPVEAERASPVDAEGHIGVKGDLIGCMQG